MSDVSDRTRSAFESDSRHESHEPRPEEDRTGEGCPFGSLVPGRVERFTRRERVRNGFDGSFLHFLVSGMCPTYIILHVVL